MLPLSVFRSRQFSAANAVTFVVYGALGGALFLVPVVLQEVCGYSPLEAGTALLPMTAIMLALSARSAALSARIGPRLQMTVGPLVIAAGLALFTRVHGNGDYLTQVLPAVLVFGLGLAINVAPLTATALSAAPAEHAGIASAVNNDVARTASLIAVAVLPALAGITGDGYLHPAELTQRVPHSDADRGRGVGGRRRAAAFATIRNPPAAAAACRRPRTRTRSTACTAPLTRRRSPARPVTPQGSSGRRNAGRVPPPADDAEPDEEAACVLLTRCLSPGLPAAGR